MMVSIKRQSHAIQESNHGLSLANRQSIGGLDATCGTADGRDALRERFVGQEVGESLQPEDALDLAVGAEGAGDKGIEGVEGGIAEDEGAGVA